MLKLYIHCSSQNRQKFLIIYISRLFFFIASRQMEINITVNSDSQAAKCLTLQRFQ